MLYRVFRLLVVLAVIVVLTSGATAVLAQSSSPGTSTRAVVDEPVVVENVREMLPASIHQQLSLTSVPALMTESFENVWPSTGWWLVDQSTADDGEYLMGKRNCHPRAGSYAGWTVGGGAKGSTLSCTSSLFPKNADTWAIYGPFDLSNETAASLTYRVWGQGGPGDPGSLCTNNYLFVGSSHDGSSFSGTQYCGNFRSGSAGNGYYQYTLDLSDQRGQSQVWIAFAFKSNNSTVFADYVGYTVDDIQLTPYIYMHPIFDTPLNVSNHPEMVNTQPALFLDRHGTTHIAYMGTHYQAGAPDNAAADIFYTNNSSGSFAAPVAITVPSGYYSYWPSIVVDQGDVVHIAFGRQMSQTSPAGDDDIWYVNNRSGSFASPLKVVDGIAYSNIQQPSNAMIEVDGGGVVHLAFAALNSDIATRVLYSNDNGGSFRSPVEAVPPMFFLFGNYTMRLDSAGWPHFTAQGKETYDGLIQTYYAKATSNPLSTPAFSTTVNVSKWLWDTQDFWAALALDASNRAHIAFRRTYCTPDPDGLYYVNNVAGAFTSPVSIGPCTAFAPWWDFDALGRLHAVYKYTGTSLWYNNNLNGPFETANEAFISDDVSFFAPRHFALGSANDLFVTYQSYSTDQIAYVHGRYPPLAPKATAGRSGSDVVLNWDYRSVIQAYEVHRSTNPYFTPNGETRLQRLGASTTTYTDAATLGHPDTGAYYYVVGSQQGVGSKSNPVGKFEYSLVTGASSWVTIAAQDFEGDFPGAWQVSDADGSTSGEYKWAKRNCQVYAGSYSGWAAGGGADGGTLACGANYANNMKSWMIYGPFSLADSTAGDLTFELWLNSEATYDKMFWGASVDGSSFNGYSTSGDSAGWSGRTLDLSSVPTLGNLLGRSSVWVALSFTSDVSINKPGGAFVDNIVLRKYGPAAAASTGLTSTVALPDDGRLPVVSTDMVFP